MTKKLQRIRTLEDLETPFGRIEVVQVNTGAILYRQGQIHQSETDGNGVSLSMYIHAIFGLLVQAWSRNVLLIGCGGGALATMLSASGAKVTVVDVNPQSFRIARRHFGLPDSVPCLAEDGAEYLKKAGKKFDAIVLDAYHDGDFPSVFADVAVLEGAKARLTKSGVFVANVYLRDDDDKRGAVLVAAAEKVWPEVRQLDEPGARLRNSIVMAGNVKSLRPPELVLPPKFDSGEIKAEMRKLRFV